MKPIISVKNLNFTYNKNKDNEFQALININLDIYPEELVIVFGPSGCGKSTLLNIFAGLEVPDTGTVQVLEMDLLSMNRREAAQYHRKKVGMIYQAYNLIHSLTVLDNVALPQVFINIGKNEREELGLKLLERFGILKQAKKIPTELSGGQQQRIGLARAIINDPEIILADEPVGNLDSVSAKNVMGIINDLNDKEKKTVIMVTHNPEYLEYGDRIIYMKDGIVTREVINKDKDKAGEPKKELKPKSPTTEINDLMRAYHGMTPEQINILIMPYKAKVFVHHFITDRNMEETKIFEDLIHRRLLGTISEEDLYLTLRRSSIKGGVGYDKRTAAKIVRRINRVIRIAYFIYQKGRQRKNIQGSHDKISRDEKAKNVTEYLLKTCYTEFYQKLDKLQIYRLQQAVKDRLSGSIQKDVFYNYLDLPFKESGVGLNSKTAKAVTEELELILILGYGIVQMHALRTSALSGLEADLPVKPILDTVKKQPAEEKRVNIQEKPVEENKRKEIIKPEKEEKPKDEHTDEYAKSKEDKRIKHGTDIESEIFSPKKEEVSYKSIGIKKDFRDNIIEAEKIASDIAEKNKAVSGGLGQKRNQAGSFDEFKVAHGEKHRTDEGLEYAVDDPIDEIKKAEAASAKKIAEEKEDLDEILKKNKLV